MNKKLVLLVGLVSLLIATLLSGACSEVRRTASGVMPYHEKHFTVPALYEQALSVELSAGDSLEGYVQVTVGGNLDVNFWVTSPHGRTIYRAPGRVKGRHDFIFKAISDGYYTLHFDNSFSLFTDKCVVVKYRRT